MSKLYYNDKYLKEFTASIVEEEDRGEYSVVLDKTAFFPGGGGQHCDLGTIDGINVTNVFERDGKVYHTLERKAKKLKNIKCKIDWNRRYDGMQQHLGQHVLSGCFFNLFKANTQGFHLGKEICTVDITGFLTEEQIREAELMANEIIMENIQVENFAPNWVELKKLNLRRDLPTTDEEIRIVKIGELDINACCGVHPLSTLELNVIKIKRWEKHKNATRIEYLAGKRAFLDYLNRDDFSKRICRELSCGEEDALGSISNLSLKIKQLNEENKALSTEIADFKVKEYINSSEEIGGYKVILDVFNGKSAKELNNLTTKLVKEEGIITLLATINEDKVNLIFACSKDVKEVNVGEILKDAITLIDGKGGGSKTLAQGGGKNNNNLEGTLKYAKDKLRVVLT